MQKVENINETPHDGKPLLPAVPLSEVFLEDCTKALKRFNDNHFDLAIVDPPYGIGADKAQNNAAMQRIKAEGKSKAGRGWKLYADTDWDNETPNAEYWNELFRVSKNQIVWGVIILPIICTHQWVGLCGIKDKGILALQMANLRGQVLIKPCGFLK